MESVTPLRRVSLNAARDTIARLVLDHADDGLFALGNIQLQPHQRSAVVRLRRSISEFGGAILCDPVGTGKTFIALALPSHDAEVLVVAPAILKGMWRRALSITDRDADFVSFESLSRGSIPSAQYHFVIVDEAHHSRNPKTARFRMLSELVARRDVVLLTATPIHNRRSDLVTLLSLFLGERAETLTSAELSRCLVRREHLNGTLQGMPVTDPLTWVRLRDDHRIPELLLSLPPPLPSRDGGDGGALVAHSLIRQWASSNGALIGGLKRRLVRAESLASALADGTWPSKSELLSWIAGDDGVQLGFAGILASGVSNTEEMLGVVQRHVDALREILARARESGSDRERAALIRKIRAAHPDRSIVAFSQYADTIDELFSALSRDGKVLAIHGAGARVAGGVISRSEAIATFAPVASGRRAPKDSVAATLLLTTDLLSEGVNLQDAGVVIHLDLPWTPARMDQRLGRVARVGSLHERVQSYAIHPPASADAIVRMEEILRRKIGAACSVVGGFPSLIGLDVEWNSEGTEPARNEAVRDILSGWMMNQTERTQSRGLAAAALSSVEGFIAITSDPGMIRVIVRLGGVIGEDLRLVLDGLRQCSELEAEVSEREIAECEASALAWIEADRALRSTRSGTSGTSVRNAFARRINRAVRRSRAHERASLALKAEMALTVIGGNLGVHDEVQIAKACSEMGDDVAFLDRIVAFDNRRQKSLHSQASIIALIVLRTK